MPGRYTYLVADLSTGAIRDELPLRGVTFSTALNDTGEFRGQLTLGDPRIAVHEPWLATAPGRTALYVERDGILVWGGVVWTARYASTERTLEITAAGFLSYFDHRRVLPSFFDPDVDDAAVVAVAFDGVDQSQIANALVAVAQEQPGGDIGVGVDDTTVSGVQRTLSYEGSQLKSVGDALRELASLDGGPDFAFDVARGPSGQVERRLRVGTPELGQKGSPHVWEYGANLVEYSWQEDGSSTATRVFAVGSNDGDTHLIAVVHDRETSRPLTETEVSYTDTSDPGLLRSQAISALATVSHPVALPELTVRADREPALGSYQVGDNALVVIKDEFFSAGVQFPVRIVALEVTPGDDAGEELVRLTVSPIQEINR